MNRTLSILAALSIVPLGAGCDEAPDQPVMCVLAAEAADRGTVDPAAVSCSSAAKHPPFVAEGDVFIVRHELPQGVEPPEDLHVEVTGPCDPPVVTDVPYGTIGDRKVALLTRAAPRGAACALVITAAIANSSLSITTEARAAECAKETCPVADAGSGGGAP